MEEIRELSMEDMAQISGGYVVDNGTGNKYWIVLQDGTVKGYAPTEAQAKEFVKAFGASTEIMTLAGYKKKFGHDLKW